MFKRAPKEKSQECGLVLPLEGRASVYQEQAFLRLLCGTPHRFQKFHYTSSWLRTLSFYHEFEIAA